MSLVVLLILAVVWAVFLVPQVLRHRAEKTPADSIGAFRNQLSVLERTTPGMPGQPAARPVLGGSGPMPAVYGRRLSQRELARRRRLHLLVGLLGAMGLTLLGSFVASSLITVHVALDVLFVAYCALLVRVRNVAAEREMKVRYLPGPPMAMPEPQLLLHRSGG